MQEHSHQSKLCILAHLCIVTGKNTYIFAWLFFLEIFAYMKFFVSVKSSSKREAQPSCFKSTKVSFTSNKSCSEINEYPRLKHRLSKCRSRHPDVFLGKGVLEICSKFTRDHPFRSAISMGYYKSCHYPPLPTTTQNKLTTNYQKPK